MEDLVARTIDSPEAMDHPPQMVVLATSLEGPVVEVALDKTGGIIKHSNNHCRMHLPEFLIIITPPTSPSSREHNNEQKHLFGDYKMVRRFVLYFCIIVRAFLPDE